MDFRDLESDFSQDPRQKTVHIQDYSVEDEIKSLPPWVIHPRQRWYHLWSNFILFWVLWAAWFAPFQWGFITDPPLGLVIFNTLINLVFMVEIGLTFVVARRNGKSYSLELRHHHIARRYLLGGFLPDVLSTIPWDLLWVFATGHAPRGTAGDILRFLPILRVHRLGAVYTEFVKLGRRHPFGYVIIHLIKLLHNILLSSHIAAVLYVFIARHESDSANTWIGVGIGADWKEQAIHLQYLAAMFWSLFLVTSIGPAYDAVTPAEKIFSALYAVYSMCLLAYTVGAFTVLCVKEASRTRVYVEDCYTLDLYSARTHLPREIKRQLRGHLELTYALEKEPWMFIEKFPPNLRAAVARHLYLPLVQGVPVFRGCSERFFNQLVSDMKLELIMPHVVVLVEGDVSPNLYVVVEGRLAREGSHAEAAELSDLHKGSVFGKMAVLFDIPQMFTVRTLEVCYLLKIDKGSFSQLLRAYPSDFSAILANLKMALKSSGSGAALSPGSDEVGSPLSRVASEGVIEGLEVDLRQRLDQADVQIMAKVCLAAAAGDTGALRQLVHGPKIANASGPDGRTPLHLAAARGSLECVRLLLKEGAEPTAVDSAGTSPLFDAVATGALEVMQAIYNAGGRVLTSEPGTALCAAAAAAPNSTAAFKKLENLLHWGVDPNARDYCGRTALHVAVHKGHAPSVKLLAAVSDLDIRDDNGRTAFQLATASNQTVLVGLLARDQNGDAGNKIV